MDYIILRIIWWTADPRLINTVIYRYYKDKQKRRVTRMEQLRYSYILVGKPEDNTLQGRPGLKATGRGFDSTGAE
jgi:hypothetical protein